MSEKICALRTRGGQLKETTLWTNPDPTQDFGFQVVTLSDDVDNYDYIKIYVGYTKSMLTRIYEYYIPVDMFKLSETSPGPKPLFAIGMQNQNPTNYVRLITGITDTTLSIGSAIVYQTSNQANSTLIPIKITGIKY